MYVIIEDTFKKEEEKKDEYNLHVVRGRENISYFSVLCLLRGKDECSSVQMYCCFLKYKNQKAPFYIIIIFYYEC